MLIFPTQKKRSNSKGKMVCYYQHSDRGIKKGTQLTIEGLSPPVSRLRTSKRPSRLQQKWPLTHKVSKPYEACLVSPFQYGVVILPPQQHSSLPLHLPSPLPCLLFWGSNSVPVLAVVCHHHLNST